jgi:twinkle protein
LLHPKHAKWLESRGIDLETALSVNLSTMTVDGGNWLAFPYLDPETGEVVNCKYRLTGQKRFRMDEGAALILWNLQALREPFDRVIITEGEMDALSAMVAGFDQVLSVPNGAPAKGETGPVDRENDKARYAPIWAAMRLLDKVKSFVIATDGDEPGRILAAELVKRLGPERCKFCEYPEGCKDLNDVLLLHGPKGVTRCIESAKPYPVQGLYKMDDFPEPPQLEPFRLRVPAMWDIWPVLPGTFTVMTGYAGRGKTTLMMACLADLMHQGVNICLGSFETAIKPIMRNELRQHLCGSNLKGITPDMRARADATISDRLTIIAQQAVDDETDFTLEMVLELAEIAVLRDGAKVLVLDPWNELDHKRRHDESETEYTGRAIRALKRFARDYQCAVVVVAHPSKPDMSRENPSPPSLYNISGSANWANKADYGIVVHRKKTDGNITTVANVKVRMGLPGKNDVQDLAYDWQTASFSRVVPLDEAVSVDYA